MSDKTNSNTTAKKEEPAWEHKVAMKVSGVSIAVNLFTFLYLNYLPEFWHIQVP